MTFLYTGTGKLHVLNETLKGGELFTTDDPRLIELLSSLSCVIQPEHTPVVEMEIIQPPKRRSRKSHAE